MVKQPKPAKQEFKAINTVSNWSYIDQLDDKDIRDREHVEVEWYDGTIEEHELRIAKGSFTYSDHGHQYDGPDHKAYIEIAHHGVNLIVYLRNQPLIRLRRTK